MVQHNDPSRVIVHSEKHLPFNSTMLTSHRSVINKTSAPCQISATKQTAKFLQIVLTVCFSLNTNEFVRAISWADNLKQSLSTPANGMQLSKNC